MAVARPRTGACMSELAVGDWGLTIKTPVGRLAISIRLALIPSGWSGSAASDSENTPLENISVEVAPDGSERVRWTQSVRKPLRLNLDFDVSVVGDRLTGVAHAGRLPASRVEGQRR